jgi:hypothetical protein
LPACDESARVCACFKEGHLIALGGEMIGGAKPCPTCTYNDNTIMILVIHV